MKRFGGTKTLVKTLISGECTTRTTFNILSNLDLTLHFITLYTGWPIWIDKKVTVTFKKFPFVYVYLKRNLHFCLFPYGTPCIFESVDDQTEPNLSNTEASVRFGSVWSWITEPNLLDIYWPNFWIFSEKLTPFFQNVFLSQKNAIKYNKFLKLVT